MKLSDRDKKLLFIVGGIVIIFLAYFFGFKKISAKNDELDKEISSNQTLYNNLRDMAARESQYKEDTEVNTSEYNNIMESFDTGASLEYTIMFLKNIEDETGAWISQAGLGATEQVYSFGKIASTNPIAGGATAYYSDYVGYTTPLTLTYEATYDNFKILLDYINTYKFKCKISSVSCSYNAEEDLVTGSIIMNTYAIAGSDRLFLGAPVSTKYKGTENIFHSDTFTPGSNADENNGNNIITDYDFYISLDAFKADQDSVVMGPRGASASSPETLSINSEEREDIEIVFSGKDGNYTVAYRIGDVSYPVSDYDKGVAFNPGEMLSVLVLSSSRSKEDGDTNGANATIINNTDMQLNIKIIDDDNNPRFNLKEKKGDIEVYEG